MYVDIMYYMYVSNKQRSLQYTIIHRYIFQNAGQCDQPGSDRHPGQLLGGADRHQQHGGQGHPRGAQPEAQQVELQAKVHTKVHNQGLKGLTSAFSFHI